MATPARASAGFGGVSEELFTCERPFLIGVRHHSAALARVVPELLERFQPERVLIELPMELATWLPWLGHTELQAPVALAAVPKETPGGLGFYPFADFSPELAAVRWALANGVDVEPCDLPIACRGSEGSPTLGSIDSEDNEAENNEAEGLLKQLLRRHNAKDSGQLWERLVETPAAAADAEAIRRAGLLFGWAVRADEGEASPGDQRREAHMRRVIAADQRRTAAVIGAFHAAALLEEAEGPWESGGEVVTALIPYTFEQLDERSGYPAGIRDPVWHQAVYSSADVEEIDTTMSSLAVGVCRELRRRGHPGSAAAAREVVRMARDLARLRGLAAPGRGELLEAITSCLAQGEVLGLGRAVAQAMEKVLIGQQRGRPAPGTPRSGLAPHVEELLASLRLPGPTNLSDEAKRLRLDPLRSPLDRARVVTLERLSLCGVPYGQRRDENVGARENLTEVWEVSWTSATAAMLELAASRGVTLEQAATGALNVPEDETLGDGSGTESTAAFLERLRLSARCGLAAFAAEEMPRLMGPFLATAGLPELVAARVFVERVRRGHEVGLPPPGTLGSGKWAAFVLAFEMPARVRSAPLLQAALAAVDALTGSDQNDDVLALLDLVLTFQQQDEAESLGAGRLVFSLRHLEKEGSPLMQGAAVMSRLMLGDVKGPAVSDVLGSWLDAVDNKVLLRRWNGAALVGASRLAGDLDLLNGTEERLETLNDDDFLGRLPGLRGGFDVLTPASRRRLLDGLLDRLPESDGLPAGANAPAAQLAESPTVLAWRLDADAAGRQAVVDLLGEALLGEELLVETFVAGEPVEEGRAERHGSEHRLSVANRWRLILGQQHEQMPALGRRAAAALDELYGQGRGEGAGESLGGGQEGSFPTAREWADELGDLFGSDVREEVLGKAAEEGRAAAIALLDPEDVTPSVDLLRQVLSLKGAMPEAQLRQLRPLVRRLIAELVKELATRVRPALTGLSTPRPTRRPSGDLDLGRTIRANLANIYEEDGKRLVVPEKLIFRGRSRRSLDWHLILVVDVSGSMEESVIYSAMMSAIFACLPALSVDFLAFSTEVIDLSERVDDPLALLLEVRVGGGTRIGAGLRAARQRLRNPSRTMVVLVSDFEEGVSVSEMLGEVRTLAAAGARLLGVAALNDGGKPRYHKAIAETVVAAGMPVAALSPRALASWVAGQVR